MPSLTLLQTKITRCRLCPELREYCRDIATNNRRRAYADQKYWGKPVPGFGDPAARIVVVGLAPGAHGANRTGRMFTGDRSGDFLYAALHRAGFANQPSALSRDDGLRLRDVYITAPLHCAPPGNRPTATQLERCRPYLRQELDHLHPAVTLCLGSIGFNAALRCLRELDQPVPRPRPKFAHGAEVSIGFTTLLGSYHVSQQNTFTGRLTESMLDAVLGRARRSLADAQGAS